MPEPEPCDSDPQGAAPRPATLVRATALCYHALLRPPPQPSNRCFP